MDNSPISDGTIPYNPVSQSTESAQPVPQTGSANTAPIGKIVNDVPFGSQNDNPRILARQIGNSTQRGTQITTGQQVINDPNNNNPAVTTSGIDQNQTFSNPSTQNNLIINGKQSDGTYGQRLFDLQGNVVAQFGEQLDGTVNLKIFASPTSPESNQGLGLAQFGRFADGSTALKIALPGFEVGTALNNQLAFNSNNPVLNVVASGFVQVPSLLIGAGLTATRTATINYTLTNNYTPLIIATTFTGGGASYLFQGIVPLGFNVGSGSNVTIQSLDFLNLTPTSTSATLTAQGYNGSSLGFTFPAYNVEYYVLQQSA